MVILSLALMLFIGPFTASTINQALVVLGFMRSCWRESWEGSGESRQSRLDEFRPRPNFTPMQTNAYACLISARRC
jgi:hypothetical protein